MECHLGPGTSSRQQLQLKMPPVLPCYKIPEVDADSVSISGNQMKDSSPSAGAHKRRAEFAAITAWDIVFLS